MVDCVEVSTHDDIPNAALELLVEHVNTFEKLDIVVAVMGDPHSTWSLDGICRAIRITPTHLRPHLDALRACGILRSTPGSTFRFRYDPASAEIDAAATALYAAFQRDRGAIIKMLRQ